MSAPSIPNLLSLRGVRGGRGHGRGRGRGGPASSSSSRPSGAGHDNIIQGTDTDAAVSRLSAVGVGYLTDPFAQYFVQNPAGPAATRRLPIINRGTYTRTTALDALVDAFIGPSENEARQVVSLGAGTDTRCFRIFSDHPRYGGLTYHELDFAAISTKKLGIVRAIPALRNILLEPQPTTDSSWRARTQNGSEYWSHGMDLRDLVTRDDASLEGLRTDVPTLLISECCLCYLQTEEAKAVIKWFTDKVPNLALVLYEPTKPGDPFGKMMTSNLGARGIEMPTLQAYAEPEDQGRRFRDAGFEHVKYMTVDKVWEMWVSPEEKKRVDGLEGLDELEEWQLLAGHYIVVWGWRGQGFESWSRI